MDALLHVEQQRRIGRLRPEVLDDIHGFRKSAGKRCALAKAGIIEHAPCWQELAAERPPLFLNRGGLSETNLM